MLQPIYLPEHIEITEEGPFTATFAIHPYHPGYGPTVGNALRRVLLSSLPGTAITSMRIEGADHEFSTLPGVKENAVSIILNLKRVRLTSISDEPVEIRLAASGEQKVTAGDFETPPGVTVVNPKLLIATLTTNKAKLSMVCTVKQGRGYAPSELQEREVRPIGTIALDAMFTPVERVSFHIENVRVGQATDYHKLLLTITTDGTITPLGALKQAAAILADHFAQLRGDFEHNLVGVRPVGQPETAIEEHPQATQLPENTLNLLQLPSRVHNALERVGITTVEQVLDLTDDHIRDIPGLGEKAIEDIKKARERYSKHHSDTNEQVDHEASI